MDQGEVGTEPGAPPVVTLPAPPSQAANSTSQAYSEAGCFGTTLGKPKSWHDLENKAKKKADVYWVRYSLKSSKQTWRGKH
jgi:hypothetical protein